MNTLTYSFLAKTRTEAEEALAKALTEPTSRAKAEAFLGRPLGEHRVIASRNRPTVLEPGQRRWEWDVEFLP